MRKKISLILMAALLCTICGCSQETGKDMEKQAEEIVQEAADQAAGIADSDDAHVLSVKNGYPESYPDITFGEAFESFFSFPTWKYFESDGGEQVVEFTGYCIYQEVEVKARLQFILNDDDTFSTGAFSLNDVPQTELMTAGMLEKVFSQYQEGNGKNPDTTGSFDDVAEEDTDSTDEYQYLDGFIQAVNSYSDPPEDADDEYYKAEYDKWQLGEAYQFIAVGADGSVYLDDQSANYNGQWWDLWSKRCYMEINSSDGTWYNIDINWSSGVADNSHWIFSGYYDSSRGGIVYTDGKYIEEHYTDSGELQENVIYTDGTGFLYLSDNTLYWEDDKEHAGDECYFEK